jgi:hypothetical protein
MEKMNIAMAIQRSILKCCPQNRRNGAGLF